MNKGYTHEVLFYGDYEQAATLFTEHRYSTDLPSGAGSGFVVSGTLKLIGTFFFGGGSGSTPGTLPSNERACCPDNGAQDTVLVDPQRTLTLSVEKTPIDDVRRLRLKIEWSSVSALGALEREWVMEIGRSALGYASVTCEFDHASGKERLRVVWADPEDLIRHIKSWDFVVDLLEAKGIEFGALDLFGPEGVLFTGLRSWAAPLREHEVEAHVQDVFSWGSIAPLDEAYVSLEQPADSEPVYVEDPFDPSTFPESPWSVNPESRRKRLLISSWDSLALRGAPEVWQNTVTCETWTPDESTMLPVSAFAIQTTPIDPRWDESTARERIRTFEENRDNIAPSEQNPGDWRFGLESSPTAALDRDAVRGLSSPRTFDDWIGGPENLTTVEYPALNDWRNSYFGRRKTVEGGTCGEGRVLGAIPYLPAMRLHRWIRSNLRGLIEELVPFNVAYVGFNNVIEPLVTERSKVNYPGSERFLQAQERLNPRGIRLIILNSIVNRF